MATRSIPEASTSAGYLIDANVLIDIITRDTVWFAWSAEALGAAARNSVVYINPVIYAEVSTQFSDIQELDRLLPTALVKRAVLPYAAGFLAAKAFVTYRRRGGNLRSPMPDFYIGAHAVVQNLTLLTRDIRRYRNYFPTLRLISPQ